MKNKHQDFVNKRFSFFIIFFSEEYDWTTRRQLWCLFAFFYANKANNFDFQKRAPLGKRGCLPHPKTSAWYASTYSLSIVNILEEQLQTFVLARVVFRTATFSKEQLFQNTYSLNVLSGYCSFWELLLLRGSTLKIEKTIGFFQSITCSRPFFKVAYYFI